MKILITGTRGLAHELHKVFSDSSVTCISKTTGHDITLIKDWGADFHDMDMVINCAYDGLGQVAVLEYFFELWKNDASKKIISIGSRVISYPRSELSCDYWPYKLHKQALQQAHDLMLPSAKCDMKIINPGPIDTEMVAHLSIDKLDTAVLASKIKSISKDATIKRIDLWI
jgi:hypothetical protein